MSLDHLILVVSCYRTNFVPWTCQAIADDDGLLELLEGNDGSDLAQVNPAELEKSILAQLLDNHSSQLPFWVAKMGDSGNPNMVPFYAARGWPNLDTTWLEFNLAQHACQEFTNLTGGCRVQLV